MSKNSLTVTDNWTGKSYEVPIEHDTIRATDLRQIKVDPDDFGLMTYDPAYLNTASCKSTITFIDGDKGILHYRGYPIEQLAEKSSYLETAYLIIYGELPDEQELDHWNHRIMRHTYIHEDLAQKSHRPRASPGLTPPIASAARTRSCTHTYEEKHGRPMRLLATCRAASTSTWGAIRRWRVRMRTCSRE